MKSLTKDVVIIGGGPGGYVAGPILASRGLSVSCVELEVLGGTCLKWGCMPTKSLASVSSCIDKINNAEKYGIATGSWKLDFGKAVERTKDHVNKLECGCESKFESKSIDLFMGFGSLKDANTVLVQPNEGEAFEIKAKHIIIDTGSASVKIPPFLDDPDIMDNKDILSMDKLPESILIVGSGVIGCEFANILVNFGSKVTMVELMDRVLPPVDEDVAALTEEELRKLGVDIELGTKVDSYEKKDGEYICKLTNGKTVKAEKILVVVGRCPNSADIGLENTKVRVNSKGHIIVDEKLRTDEPSIYAMGDVIGGTLAHVARMEGEIVARIITGEELTMDYKVVPWAIFTNLEIGGVGLTEQKAKEQGLDYVVSVSKFKSNGKAMVSDEDKGFVKVIADRQTKEIIGAQIIGPHASDLIHEMALAIKCGLTAPFVSSMIHVHPTLAEAVLKACQQL